MSLLRLRLITIAILLPGLASCSSAVPQATATPVPSPTATTTPRPTPPPPTATSTPWPTPEPTKPAPTPSLGKTVSVRAGNFEFRPVMGYDVELSGKQAYISTPYSNRFFTLIIMPVDADVPTEFLVEFFTHTINLVEGAELEVGEVSPVVVGPLAGVTGPITGKVAGLRVRGRVSITKPRANQAFFAYGLVFTETDKTEWQDIAQGQYDAMLSTLSFTNVTLVGESCPVSTQANYGASSKTPIPIGGGRLNGLPLEVEYLQSIRGPSGEELSFSLVEPLQVSDSGPDSYEVTYSGLSEPITLFFDPYSVAAPVAPANFTCAPGFPHSAPAPPAPNAAT